MGGLGGDLLALEATRLLNQDTEPDGTAFLDARNGKNELRRLEMIWTVCHHCPAGRGNICVQLLQASGTASLPPDYCCTSHPPEKRGGYPG